MVAAEFTHKLATVNLAYRAKGPYLILGKRMLHVVIISVVKHIHRVLAQPAQVVGAHGLRGPWHQYTCPEKYKTQHVEPQVARGE